MAHLKAIQCLSGSVAQSIHSTYLKKIYVAVYYGKLYSMKPSSIIFPAGGGDDPCIWLYKYQWKYLQQKLKHTKQLLSPGRQMSDNEHHLLKGQPLDDLILLSYNNMFCKCIQNVLNSVTLKHLLLLPFKLSTMSYALLFLPSVHITHFITNLLYVSPTHQL